jgi:hypothetical protein
MGLIGFIILGFLSGFVMVFVPKTHAKTFMLVLL